jgi:arginase family enzyme
MCWLLAQHSARFGPTGIRLGSRRLSKWFNTDIETGFNALNDWAKIVDCGDVCPCRQITKLIQVGHGDPLR